MEASYQLYLLLILIVGLVLFGWFVTRRLFSAPQAEREAAALLLMQQQIDQLRAQLAQALDASARQVQQQLGQMLGHVSDRLKENAEAIQSAQQGLGARLDNAARVVGEVQRSLGTLEEANRRIYEVGKDIASLQEILSAPKLRGGLGEFFLEDLLAQILPADHFSTQHAFRNGEKVDAVIKIGSSLVPVDAKFPLENFRRLVESTAEEDKVRARRQFVADVKRHIDTIAEKYILPDEGTYDFALMYIPAENIYYETIIKDESAPEKNLGSYALGKKVIPVSPNSFYAYLQAIVLGLKGMRVESRAEEILQRLARLQGDFERFRDDFELLGKHLGHAQSSFYNAEKRLDQFGQKLTAAEGEPSDLAKAQALGRGNG